MSKHPDGYIIGNGAAWIGRKMDGFYWQDGTDPEAVLHGPCKTADEAEKQARLQLHMTEDE